MSDITMNEYQTQALGTAVYPNTTQMPVGLMYVALKLAGEAGEFAEKIGKIVRDKSGVISPEDTVLLIKELGDISWYVSAGAKELGVTLGDVATQNLAKLADRKQRGVIGGSGDVR